MREVGGGWVGEVARDLPLGDEREGVGEGREGFRSGAGGRRGGGGEEGRSRCALECLPS